MPKPHVLGHLEYLWQSGYQAACSIVGDEVDVELVSEWNGEQGILAKALIEPGFIDQTELGLEIHDFWTHAPKYVIKRAQTEERLNASGTSLSEVRRVAGLKGAEAKWLNHGKPMANGWQMDGKLPETDSKVMAKTSPPFPSLPLPKVNTLGSDKPKRKPQKVELPEIEKFVPSNQVKEVLNQFRKYLLERNFVAAAHKVADNVDGKRIHSLIEKNKRDSNTGVSFKGWMMIMFFLRWHIGRFSWSFDPQSIKKFDETYCEKVFSKSTDHWEEWTRDYPDYFKISEMG
jgi:hypothetical protein